jgi:hypothetical protein
MHKPGEKWNQLCEDRGGVKSAPVRKNGNETNEGYVMVSS